MTALAGRWNFNLKPDAGRSCVRMLAAQQIYGPDGGSHWDGGAVALGRRLFRTVFEDLHDRQPLVGASGRFILVADVRIDNRDELAGDLRIDAAEAEGLSDSAILLAAWERWQEEVFDHLFGDYAFAVWDARDRRLLMARDALGARPLHYHLGNGFVAFASMPKGLHALPDVPYAPDEERMAEFLALMPESGPRSFFKDVSRVETGHLVIVTPAGITARRHWEPRQNSIKLKDSGDHVEALRHHLDIAVEARLRGSAGRVGAHLSAGFDSSAVAATAARLLAPNGGKVVAFTSVPRDGYDGPAPKGRLGDESELAGATAALYPNMDHVLVRPTEGTVMDDLDRHFFLFDRPVVNACNQRWMNAINVEARMRDIRVLLSGGMGNHTISYGGLEGLPELVAQGRWLRLLREGGALVKSGEARLMSILARSFGPWAPASLWNFLGHLRKWRSDPAEYTALNRNRRLELDIDRRAREVGLDLSYRPRKDSFEARLWSLRRVDQGNQNKGTLGGWGVDLRDPTADRRLIEFCLSLPVEAYLSRGKIRALGKQALADRLPDRVLNATGRGLQAIDWHEGLTASRERLGEEINRLNQVPSAAAALDLDRMRSLVENWPTEGWNTPETMSAYRLALLRGVVNGHFLRRASRSNA